MEETCHRHSSSCVVAVSLKRDPSGDAGPCQYAKTFCSLLRISNLVQVVFSNNKMLATGTTATKHTSMRWMTCWMRWRQCCSRMAWTSFLPAMCMPMSGFTAPTSACDHLPMFRVACLLYVTSVWTHFHACDWWNLLQEQYGKLMMVGVSPCQLLFCFAVAFPRLSMWLQLKLRAYGGY